ncbi:hypothetical protein Tco_1265868 [Tanacetum coccineum]
MITGKWSTLTRDCNKFVGIVDEHQWLSGENDSTWLSSCYKVFTETWGYAFVHYQACDVLKDHHKWRCVKVVVPGRRVRKAEDIEDPNELFRDDTIPRPPDKSRPTKSQKSDSSKSAGSSSTCEEAFMDMVQEELRLERARKLDLSKREKKSRN